MYFAFFIGNIETIHGNNKLAAADDRRKAMLFCYYNTTYAKNKEKF